MSHTHTRKHTREPIKLKPNLRAIRQRGIAQQRREEAALRERYQADTTAPEPETTGRYVP